MKKISLICFGACALLLSACKNDLDVVDDYRETMVVYGLLDPADTAQYIKINKAFLGHADAYTMAGQYDSSNYVHGEITAYLQRWLNGVQVGANIPLVQDSLIPRSAGVFANPGQMLYKTTTPIVQDGSDYLIYVVNNRTGKTATAKTDIIQQFNVTTPILNQTINLVGQNVFTTKWKTAAKGRLFSLTVRMHYKERFVFDTLQVADKYIDLIFDPVRSGTLSGGEQLEQAIAPRTFFQNIKNSPLLNTDPQKERFFQSLEFIFSAAAEDFSTYMDVQNTTIATFGDHPFFSNITGGVGLFSSRYNYSIPNIGLNAASKDSLKNGQYTYDLRFR
ncbi:MAG TPA: hypothetical protein VI112_15895 [Bacteroidia bacterium]